MAPESVKRDSDIILNWLAAQDAGALKPKHYGQFTAALRAYMTECDSSVVRQVVGPVQLSPPINDDIRAVFDRMLEREQAALVFNDALSWFATIWLGLIIALNLIVGIILLITAPTLAAGLGKFAATYSPLNLWCWVCQIFAFSPAAIAMYVKRERAQENNNIPGSTKPLVGLSGA